MRILVLLATMSLALPAAADTRVELEPEPIYGTPHLPQVTVVITRRNLDAGYHVQLRESFLPKIVRSVEQGPF